MSEFEFYSVAISIVLALALGKLVSSIPSVFSRDRFDWVFGLFYVVALLGPLFHWKQVWKLHAHASWSMIDFGLLMAPSIALYLAIHVLISDTPVQVVSWRDHFQRVHRWFFVAFLASLLTGQARDRVLVDDQIKWAVVLFGGFILVMGAVLERRTIHAIVGLLLVGFLGLQYWRDFA